MSIHWNLSVFCSYVRLLQGCIARTEASGGNITLPGHDSPMHEIENAAEALMKDL